MNNRITYPLFKATTATGAPAVGYKLYTYEAGTSTPATVYQDSALTTAHTNPIVLNSAGEAEIYTDQNLKLTLTDADGVVQTGWPVDDIDPTTISASEVSVVPSGGFADTNVQDLFDSVIEELGNKLDASDVAADAVPTGVLVTGDVYGFEISKTDTNEVTIQPGWCMNSDNSVELELTSAQALTLPSDVNGVYHLFACDDGAIRYDTDVDGSTHSGTYDLRWIRMVFNDASGVLMDFTFDKGILIFTGNGVQLNSFSDSDAGGTAVTTYQDFDLDTAMPSERVLMLATSNTVTGTYSGIHGRGCYVKDSEAITGRDDNSYLQHMTSDTLTMYLSTYNGTCTMTTYAKAIFFNA